MLTSSVSLQDKKFQLVAHCDVTLIKSFLHYLMHNLGVQNCLEKSGLLARDDYTYTRI